jgi:hypothetical protein
MGARRSRADWIEIVRTYEETGEPLRTFCARRRIRPDTLKWWRWRLRSSSRAMTKVPTSDVRLVPVDVIGLTAAARSSTIVIAVSEVEVRIEVGADAGYVGTLVAALRSRC